MSMGYLILEARRAMRSTRFLIFTIGMPVALFLLYTGIWGNNDPAIKGVLMINMACYGAMTERAVEAGNVFTLELGVMTAAGFVGLEEDVLVTAAGCEFLSSRQRDLMLV